MGDPSWHSNTLQASDFVLVGGAAHSLTIVFQVLGLRRDPFAVPSLRPQLPHSLLPLTVVFKRHHAVVGQGGVMQGERRNNIFFPLLFLTIRSLSLGY